MSPPARTILDWLVERYPSASRQTLRRMLEHGRVMINGRPAKSLKQPVEPADVVKVLDRAQRPEPTADPLEIVYEDDEVLVVHKPAGVLTSTVPRERRPTALGLLREYLAHRQPTARLGLIHRLDRDAAGLLVFSKSNFAFESLKGQFFRHSVTRQYLAVVDAVPPQARGRIESRLVEMPSGDVRSTRREKHGERAVTEWEMVQHNDHRALLRVTLLTGRKHQIRVHLSEKKWPIVGDAVYHPKGSGRSELMLLAAVLEFEHPRSGKRMRFERATPDVMLKLTAKEPS